MARKEAEQAARREFGNVALIEERSREAWQWPTLESVLADLKLTLRRLRKSPGFAATVLLTLAIGIGANTAVFSVVNSVLLKPLPYPDSGRLVALRLNAPGAAGLANFAERLQLSPSMYLTFAEHNRTFRVDGHLDAGHGQRHRPCAAGRGAHGADQRRRAGDAGRSAGCWAAGFQPRTRTRMARRR